MDADQASHLRITGARDGAAAFDPAASRGGHPGYSYRRSDGRTGTACRGAAVEYDIARAEVQEAAQVYQRCLAAVAAPAQKNSSTSTPRRIDMLPR